MWKLELPSVLVAEDNASLLELVSRALRLSGFQVEVARNGLEVLGKFEDGNFDVVLTDIHMPYLDGYEVAQYIRASDKKIPVIGMSAEIDGLGGDFDLFLEKPFSLNQLKETVLEALSAAHAK